MHKSGAIDLKDKFTPNYKFSCYVLSWNFKRFGLRQISGRPFYGFLCVFFPPATSVVSDDVATLFCCEAP